ncbi:MAG TPA: aminotransferase class IV [Actinoplanes sp.]|nr:aminotransferase class IV [Actinoplanes sp.]
MSIMVEIDGVAATVEAVHRAASWNYGHYTSMQVRGRAVAGLALHLNRLAEASAVLFPGEAAPGGDRIRELIGHALGDRDDASVRVTVLPGASVMVAVSDPVPGEPRAPLRVRTTTYERELPHLKHVATLGLSFHAGEARRAGFDDVLFVRRDGAITEGSVWNAAFWDGTRVVWPDGPQLTGITMLLLRQGLDRIGVPHVVRRLTRDDLGGMTAAAAANSHCPAQPIAAVDGWKSPGADEFTGLLWRAWREAAWEPVGSSTPVAGG